MILIMRKEFLVYVSIGRLDSELLSNSMKVSRGGIIMKSHCCDADTYNRKVGLFLRNARVSFIMQSTVMGKRQVNRLEMVEIAQMNMPAVESSWKTKEVRSIHAHEQPQYLTVYQSSFWLQCFSNSRLHIE